MTLVTPGYANEDSALRGDLQSIRPAIANRATWALRLPQSGKQLQYHGVVNYDQAGTHSASMLYPAPNVAGFIAAVITHGLLIESAKKKQKESLQAGADNALSPYKEVLSSFTYADLMQRALQNVRVAANGHLADSTHISPSEMVVESDPIFYLTQDQRALISENSISIYSIETPTQLVYKNTIRVVSAPIGQGDSYGIWTANDGAKLKEVSAKLVAISVDTAFQDVSDNADAALVYKTIRYPEGGAEKIERAQVISQQCDRILARSLRGTLISVPVQNDVASSTNGDCTPGVAASK